PVHEYFVTFHRLRVHARHILLDGGVHAAQLFERRIYVDDGTARLFDQIEGMSNIGAELVQTRTDRHIGLGHV
ncbi:MAG: hypothetical protein C4346_09325, partial [Chloroflexota bacterium]